MNGKNSVCNFTMLNIKLKSMLKICHSRFVAKSGKIPFRLSKDSVDNNQSSSTEMCHKRCEKFEASVSRNDCSTRGLDLRVYRV